MKDLGKLLTGIMYVGQLGLDLIMPVVLCLGGAWYLDSHFGVGGWIYFLALFLGLGAGGCAFSRFYHRVVMKGLKKPDKKKPRTRSWSKHY